MSAIGDVMDAFLAKVNTATSGYTTLRGFKPLPDIRTSDFDFAMAFAPVYTVSEVLEWRQEVRLYAFTVVMAKRGTPEALLVDFDDVSTALSTDRRLGLGTAIDWVHIESMALDERVDATDGVVVLAMEVIGEVTL